MATQAWGKAPLHATWSPKEKSHVGEEPGLYWGGSGLSAQLSAAEGFAEPASRHLQLGSCQQLAISLKTERREAQSATCVGSGRKNSGGPWG